MPQCQGECKVQEQQVRGMKVEEVDLNLDQDETLCRPLDKGHDSVKAAGARVKNELETPVWLTVCRENCKCSLQPDEVVPWGEWLDGQASVAVVRPGPCLYTVRCVYQIRGRIRSGACVTTHYS